jgi:hypothetical protein
MVLRYTDCAIMGDSRTSYHQSIYIIRKINIPLCRPKFN